MLDFSGYWWHDIDSRMVDPKDFVVAGDSDISVEEQKEILGAIENVARENRITATAEVFRYRPVRKGFVLPLIVNIAAILTLILGIAASSFIGRRDDRRLAEGTAVLRSAEGRVLQELRRELEDRLQQKDQEIAQVRQRLESIRGERDRLVATMEEKISQKERELRAALEAELAAERARLLAAGETQERIAALLVKLEQARTAQNQEQIAAYRRQLESERLALEASLGKMQGEYEGRLNELNRERAALLAEYRQKEESLHRELEQQKARLSLQEQQARRELELLKAQQERQDLTESQILGFYASVQKAVASGDLNGALSGLEALQGFLENPELRSMPRIQERLAIDRFLIAELGARVRGELKQSATPISELLDSARLLERLKASASAAWRLAEAGQRDAAVREYRAAFGLLPELLAGLELALRGEQEASAAERRRLERELAAMRAAQPAEAQPQDVPEAIRILESAQALNQRGEHRAAIEEYLKLLRSYPLSRQAEAAVEGVRAAVGLQEARMQNELQDLRRRIEQFDTRQAGLREELERLKPLADRQSGLEAGYTAYLQQEGSIKPQAGPRELLQAKQFFDSFLASEPVRQVFPGLLERIHRFDSAFEQEGRTAAVSELIDMVYDLSSYETKAERLQFIEKEIQRQRGNKPLQELLKELANLLKG